MKNDCVFCAIAAGEIPCFKVYEDELALAYLDINPFSEGHTLVIPKAHIASVAEINSENSAVISHIFEVIAQIARDEKLDGGYRVVSNCGDDAGQTVHHLHFHILGGEKLSVEMA